MKPHKLESNVVEMLLPRILDEYNAFYFYRSADNWLNETGYLFASQFFKAESADELEHAKGLEEYIVSWNVIPNLPNIEKPVLKFSGLVDVIEQAYEMEYALYEAYEKTAKEMFPVDLCTFALMQTYLGFQLKAVAEYSDLLNQIDLIDKNDKLSVMLLEQRLFKK